MANLNVIYRIAADISSLEQNVRKGADTMDSLGTKALKVGKVLAASFVVKEVGQFIGEVIKSADAIQRMSDKTGIGVEALQDLDAVARESGNTIEQVTAAITQMQNRLASGDRSAVAALNQMGMSLEAIRDLTPDQQFIAIAQAIAGIEDPGKRAQMAIDLFGRAGAEVLPTMRADIEALTAAHVGMSAQTVATLDALGDAWGRFWNRTKVAIGNVTALAIESLQAVKAWVESINEALQISTGARSASSGMPGVPNAPGAPAHGLPTVDPAAAEAAFSKLHGTVQQQLGKSKRAMEEADEAAVRLTESIAAAGHRISEISRGSLPAFHDGLDQIGTRVDAVDPKLRGLWQQLEELDRESDRATTIFRATGQGLENVGTKAAVTTPKLRTMGDTVRSAFEDVAAILDAIPGKFAEIGAVVARTGKAIMDNLANGNIWGAVVAGVTGAITALGKLFGNSERNKVRKMFDEFVRASGGIERLAMKARLADFDLAKLFNASKVKDFEAAVRELERRLELQKTTWEKVKAAVEKYKFSMEELGPALQGAMLDEQAQQLYEDFMLLTGAGIDLETALRKMAPDINKMVLAYLAAGIAIPDVFKSIIEKLIEMGLLVDADGNKIEDLASSGIEFTMSMSEGFHGVINALREMIDLLKLFLGLTQNPPDWSEWVPPAPPHSPDNPDQMPAPGGGAGGGIPNIPGFAGGTGGRFVDFGRGTLAMLHGEEMIVPRGSGGAGDGSVIHTHVYLDGREIASSVERVQAGDLRARRRLRAA